MPLSDIKADRLYEKFILLFPSWEEKVLRYKRKGEVLVLITRSNNALYFWLDGNDFVLTTKKGVKDGC